MLNHSQERTLISTRSTSKAFLSNQDLTVKPPSNYVTLAEGTTSVAVNASPRDQSVTLEGTGNQAISGNMGAIELTVTSTDGNYSLNYVIHYVVETSLSLKHAYTFADGTAKDVVGGADGNIVGGKVENGTYIALEQGHYIELPGEEIAINTYPAITVEAYVTAGSGENGGHTMLTYFGNTTGSFGTDYFYTALANGGKSRAAISTGSYSRPWGVENGVDGLLIDDGMPHHVVSTLTYDSISWYIDGLLVNKTAVTGTKLISNLSNALAYIGKGGYVNDATWIGSVFEYNIYSGVMDDNAIAMRSISFPVEDESSNATLASLMLDGDTIDAFASYKLNYEILLPEGTTSAPIVTASTSNTGATAVVSNAASVPGATTIVVTAEDGSTIVTYTINFTIETSSVSLENNAVKVFPTISNASFTVTANEPVKRIIVFDLLGNKVKSMNDIGLSGEVSIERPGMYLMVVESDNTQNMFRVIKK